MDKGVIAFRQITESNRISIWWPVYANADYGTYNDPTILPPLPFSAARCTPDKTGGSNRRLSWLDNTSLNTKTTWTFGNDVHNSIEIRKLCLSAAVRECIPQSIYFSLKTLVSSRMAYKKIENICNGRRRCVGSCSYSKASWDVSLASISAFHAS